MPRFVLLYHDCPADYVRASHWDLMLESGDMLNTWAVARLPRGWSVAHRRTAEKYAECPPLADGNEVAAEQLADHRLRYLEYEGEVSGQRGRVIRVASGSYCNERDAPDCHEVSLEGDTISGGLKLWRENGSAEQWTLSCVASPRPSG